jgi:hypothetical protein
VGEIQHDKCSTEQRTRAIRWVGAPPCPLCPACAPAHLRTCAPAHLCVITLTTMFVSRHIGL